MALQLLMSPIYFHISISIIFVLSRLTLLQLLNMKFEFCAPTSWTRYSGTTIFVLLFFVLLKFSAKAQCGHQNQLVFQVFTPIQ